MTARKKYLLLGIGLLLALLVAAAVLIKTYITPEKIRATVIPLAEQQLQRKVEVGEINIGIFSGISLTDLKVMQRDGAEEFISARSMALSYQFWPLLTGKLVLDEISLQQPKIVIIRHPDGRFNFSDLQQASSPDQAAKPASAPVPTAAVAGAIDLLVQQVTIDNGELLFIDRLKNSQAPYRYSLTQLSLQARQITLDKAFPLKFSTLLNGSKIELAGEYDIAKTAGNFDLRIAPLDLVQFSPYYRDALPGKLGSAQLSVNLEAALQGDKITSKGRIALGQLDLVLNVLPDTAVKQAELSVDYALDYQLDQQALSLSTLLVNYNGIALAAEGDVQLAGAEPRLNLALLLNKLDLRKLSQGLPAGLVAELEKLALSGQVDGKIALTGVPSAGAELVQSARFELAQVRATLPAGQAVIDGVLSYAGQIAQAEKLRLSLNDQVMLLSFNLHEPLGALLRGDFQLEADSLDLNRLTPATAAGGVPTGTVAADKMPPVEGPQTLADEVGPFSLPVVMKGTLLVNRLLYRQLTMNKLQADLQLKDNHLILSRLRSELAGGELSADADIDLGVKGLTYAGQLQVGQANLTTLVAGLYPQAKQSVSGLLEWQNNFSGRGTLPASLLKQLQLDGNIRIGTGKLAGSPLLEQFSALLGSPELKVLSFNDFTGNYNLQNGVAGLKADLDSSKIKLRPEGTIGLDGALNLKLDARLAPALLAKLGGSKDYSKFVADADGWGVFPLEIKGSLDQPQFGYDTKALQKLATDQVTQKATDQLLKKLGDKAGDQAPVKQLLDGTLKKLFGN